MGQNRLKCVKVGKNGSQYGKTVKNLRRKNLTICFKKGSIKVKMDGFTRNVNRSFNYLIYPKILTLGFMG